MKFALLRLRSAIPMLLGIFAALTPAASAGELAPAVTAVHGITAAGTYTGGASFLVRVSFDQAVIVSGTPTLTLETGEVDRVIPYESGSGSAYLFFRYIVRPGDTSSDLDYASTAALALNGGTIRDAEGNDAALTLPEPGASGSLAANEAFVIAAAANTALTGLALTPARRSTLRCRSV